MRLIALLKMAMLIAITSCESQDRRLAEYAQRATDQQARQNKQIADQAQAVARQSEVLASAAHDLVEQDAAARRELIQAHDKLQSQNQVERTMLDRQREQVEAVRKSTAAAAARNPVIGQAIVTAGLILAALLPLLVTAYALRRLPEHRPEDDLLTDALLQDFVPVPSAHMLQEAEPGSQAHSASPRLDGPEEPPASASDS
jgi:hypothetical protein